MRSQYVSKGSSSFSSGMPHFDLEFAWMSRRSSDDKNFATDSGVRR
jgi:hypothetical protein